MNYAVAFVLGVISSVTAYLIVKLMADKLSTRFSFQRVYKDTICLLRKIEAADCVPDQIIGIDRSGSIIGSILAGYLGIRTIISAGTKHTRHADGTRSVSLRQRNLPRQGVLDGKRVLLVSCFVDTGSAAEAVRNYYASMENGPSKICFAALYTTKAPRYKPQYFVYEAGRDIKASMDQIMHSMPWVSEGWKHAHPDDR